MLTTAGCVGVEFGENRSENKEDVLLTGLNMQLGTYVFKIN